MSKAELALERKAQIINATIECISKYGYHNFSMQDVARTADVSKGIIHYYFLNKEDLMKGVLDRVSGDIESLLAKTEQQSQPTERVRGLIRMLFNVVREKKEYYLINIDFWTQINQKEDIKHAVANHYAKFRSTLGTIIQQGIDAGVFKKSDASRTASVIIALVDGIGLQWLFDPNVFNYDEVVKSCEDVAINLLMQ